MEAISIFSYNKSELETIMYSAFKSALENHKLETSKTQIQTEPQRFYGDSALAKYLGCTVQTINQLKKTGKLPFHRVGRKYYYIQSEVDQAFMGNTHKFKK